MNAPRLPTETRKQQIVAATLELLGTTSLDRLSTRQVARSLGISQPALFRHYRSREALLVDVVEYARAELGLRLAPVIGSSGPALERLEGVARTLAHYVEGHAGLPRLLFADSSLADGPLCTALRGILAMQRALIAQLFAEGRDEGTLRDDVEPEDAASFFVGLMQGLVREWQLGSGALGPRIDGMLGLWRDGVARPEPLPPVHPTPRSAPSQQVTLKSLDVRPTLAGGGDPLAEILSELDTLGPGGLLHLIAPFRPVPLLALLDKRGHRVEAELRSADTWSVTIVVFGTPAIADLRDLEPPEPLEATLHALARLEPGAVFIARLPRYPRLLVPHLERSGLAWILHEDGGLGTILHVYSAPPS